ncbi:hypothetical protein BC834DRAFT_843706 [Gloeopeniophorella convolvens]|nr:hypothetical protein BC834DRAFT_843706 [Gloeopeniophorella convolvens]
MTSSEPERIQVFREWLESHGGCFLSISSGFSIIANEPLDAETPVVTCPLSIVITPALSQTALLTLLGNQAYLQRWTERQLMIAYICFHWIVIPDGHEALIHLPYINTLPSEDQLTTPLHFTEVELDSLKGTNLYGATKDRFRDWEIEWEQCAADVSTIDAGWAKEFTWRRYLTASTYLSSRAFPSTLLSPSPSLIQRHDSHPVLIPGVDSLNHARAQPVSWVVNHPASATEPEASISLITRTSLDAGAEIFNNYGAKPNSELLLGYGFTLPDNPDDTIVLRIGGAGDGAQHEVGRSAQGADNVWAAVVEAIQAQGDEELPEWQICLESADTLRSMTEELLQRLPGAPAFGALRADVAQMIRQYVTGQRKVLGDLVEYANEKEADGVAMAHREGIVIRFGG